MLDGSVSKKAHAFVRDNGSPLARVLVGHALGLTAVDEALSELVAFQNPDGGWRGLDSDMQAPLSTISQTWVGLKWLHWLGPPDAAPVDRTVEFLRRSQHPEGCWDEPEAILEHGPPPWMVPGDYANQVWLTAATCSRLMLHSRQAGVSFDAALDFLRAAWDGERFPRYNHTHWVSLVVFGLMKNPSATDRDIFEGSVRFLEGALEDDRIDTSGRYRGSPGRPVRGKVGRAAVRSRAAEAAGGAGRGRRLDHGIRRPAQAEGHCRGGLRPEAGRRSGDARHVMSTPTEAGRKICRN